MFGGVIVKIKLFKVFYLFLERKRKKNSRSTCATYLMTCQNQPRPSNATRNPKPSLALIKVDLSRASFFPFFLRLKQIRLSSALPPYLEKISRLNFSQFVNSSAFSSQFGNHLCSLSLLLCLLI